MRHTSSDIPQARIFLNEALKGRFPLREAIRRALLLMVRKTPDFRAPKTQQRPPLAMRRAIRRMRRQGYSQRDIAKHFDINQGRVSEAINGLRLKRRGHSRRVVY